MLRHLKLKAAAADSPEDVVEEVAFIEKTKAVEEEPTTEIVESPQARIGPLELPLFNSRGGKAYAPLSGNPHFDRDDRVPQNWQPMPETVLDIDTRSDVVYNYKSTCTDPGCHCSPTAARRVFPHSPKIEEFCHCLACQQVPRLVHHNHLPFCHPTGAAHIPESAPHLHHPAGGVFYPPEASIGPPHPVFHSPTMSHHGGGNWARYADPVFSHTTQNLFSRSAYNQDTWKLPQATFPGPSTSTTTSEDIQKLSLPLSRDTIVSLVKSGKCDIILESLNGPLHDEASPLYPLALKTVLDILDVIEKDFTHTYQSDRRVESDIHQLSNFVKNMEKSTLAESSVGHPEPQKNPAALPKPTRMEVGAQFPDLPPVRSLTPVDQGPDVRPEGDIRPTDALPLAPSGSADDNDTGKKPLASINIGGAIISGDDIANILAAFRAKGSLTKPPPPASEGSVPVPVEKVQCDKAGGEEDGVDVPEAEESKTDTPTEGKLAADQPEPSESSSANQITQLEKHGEDLNADLAVDEKSQEGKDSPTVSVSRLAADLPKDQLDLDVVDALLDQTLLEADKARDESKKAQKNASSEPSSNYRSKGFKIRSVGSTEEGQNPPARTKAPVKTFSQILTDLSDLSKLPKSKTDSHVAIKEKPKDVNDNLPQVSSLNHGNESSVSDGKKGTNTTPELPRCPSNPLSPSPSESLDGAALFKKKSECVDENTPEPVVKPGVTSATVSSILTKKGAPMKPPALAELAKPAAGVVAPREFALPNSIGKPLMSKSFHGKLLLQKNSKDDPYPIPLEGTDPSLVLRDPRLALSNLMDYRGNSELAVLHWQTEVCDSNQKTCLKGTETSSLQPLNVRDPRVRRRLSGDMVTGAPSQVNVQKVPQESSNKDDQPMPSCVNNGKRQTSTVDGHLQTEPKERSSSSACSGGSKHVKSVDGAKPAARIDKKNRAISQKHHVKSLIVPEGPKAEEDSTTRSGLVKSVIVTNAEKPRIVSAPGPLSEPADEMDTKSSFQESLSILKGIKSDIKKELRHSGGRMEKVDKEKASSLSQRVTELAGAVKVSLLSTDRQKRKAQWEKVDMLSGLLEDHFILTADLTIMRLWLKGEIPVADREGLLQFGEGIFCRRTAPPLKKIQGWLQNRYIIDGFQDEVLFKIVKMIDGNDDEKRSRSRSSSAGSDQNKRKRSECSQSKERQRVKSVDGGSPDKSSTGKKVPEDKSVEESEGRAPSSKGAKRHLSTENEAAPSKKDLDALGSDIESVSDNGTPVDSAGSSSESDEGKLEPSKGVTKRKATGEDEKLEKKVKKCKQSVTVSNCIQDLPQEMSDIKREVLIALSDRNTKIANKCLEKLPEMSRKAHAQLDDESKTYTSLKNASPDTRAKFNDVIKGIQRLIVDCEIMIYSLSWKANRTIAREAKDTIWTIAQKSSHKPSYEEELALLLSLRKSYTSTDLWRYVKTDVDDRIDSLQKKCRSSQKLAAIIQDYPISDRKPSWSSAPQFPPNGPPQSGQPMQSPIPVHQGYSRASDMGFDGPLMKKNVGYQNNYITSVVRGNCVGRPAQQFPPLNPAPYQREGYPLPSQPLNPSFPRHPVPPPPPTTSPPVRDPPGDYDYWRYDAGRGKPGPGSYDGSNRYTPPMMM